MLPGWIRTYRLAFGILALAAVFRNYVVFDEWFFWRLFTNQSSLIAGIVLILGAVVFPHRRPPIAWDIIRGTAVMMMLTTGVVYAALLGGLYNPFSDAHPWSSSVMHQLLPVVMVVDLLIVPLHRRVPMWTMVFFTIYPLAWLGVTLTYGADTGWYPYDFLDPSENGGVTGVATTVGAMVIGFLVIAAVIIRLGKIMRTGSGAEPMGQRVH
jgi:hypothetical protein